MNLMLHEDMNISRQMSHAQHFEGDKLRDRAKKNKKARIGNYDNSQQKLGGVISCSFSKIRRLQHLHHLVFHLPSFVTIKKLGNHPIRLNIVFQAREHTNFPKYSKNHPSNCLAEKERYFGYGQSSHTSKDCTFRQGQYGNNVRGYSRTSSALAGHLTQHDKTSYTCGGQC